MSPTDVVVIGAGAVGCTTAYFLAQQGVKAVVVEKDAIGTHASGFAFGGLRPFTIPAQSPPLVPLSKEGMRLHLRLAEELREATGIDTELRRTFLLNLAADEVEAARLKAELPRLLAQGFAFHWLDAEELHHLEPRLAPSLPGGLYTEGVAVIECYRHCLALAQAAEQMGARFRHGEIKGLRVENGRLTAVETHTEIIPCRWVVVAGGPWTGLAGDWLGLAVPVRPLKGQMVRLRWRDAPVVGDFNWRASYFTSKSDGLIWAGTTEEETGFDERTTAEGRDLILTRLANVCPALLDAEIVQQTACLRPLSVDGVPILGPVPGIDGVYLATGAGRKGILLSSIMGRIAADLVLRGKTDWEIAALSPARFAGASAPRPPSPAPPGLSADSSGGGGSLTPSPSGRGSG